MSTLIRRKGDGTSGRRDGRCPLGTALTLNDCELTNLDDDTFSHRSAYTLPPSCGAQVHRRKHECSGRMQTRNACTRLRLGRTIVSPVTRVPPHQIGSGVSECARDDVSGPDVEAASRPEGAAIDEIAPDNERGLGVVRRGHAARRVLADAVAEVRILDSERPHRDKRSAVARRCHVVKATPDYRGLVCGRRLRRCQGAAQRHAHTHRRAPTLGGLAP